MTGEDYINMLDDNPPENMIHWINFFKSNPDKIFAFPMAKRSKIGQTYDFDDHYKIINFLQNNPITNPIHKISLSERAILFVKNLRFDANYDMQTNIKSIFELMAKDYNEYYYSDDFQAWIEALNDLKSLSIDEVWKLSIFISDRLPNKLKYCKKILRMYDINDIIKFSDTILHLNNQQLEFRKIVNESVDQALSELQLLHDIAEEREEYERKIEQQKKNRRIAKNPDSTNRSMGEKKK